MEAPEETLQTPQRSAKMQWLAMLFGSILILINAYVYLEGWKAIDTQALLDYMILGGGIMMALILFILGEVGGELRDELNLKPGKWIDDIFSGCLLGVRSLILTLGLIALPLSVAYRAWEILIGSFFGYSFGYNSIETNFLGKLVNGLNQLDDSILFVFLGPALLIGFAGFDELSRAFLLTRWMKVSTSKRRLWAGVFLSAALVSLSQLYLGLAGFLIGLISGSILGAWYLHKGRIWQLIIARYVFTVIQYLFFYWYIFWAWAG